MSKHAADDRQGDDRWADLRSRFQDIHQPTSGGRRAVIKDRLAIVAVVLVLAFLVFLLIDGSIENFRCSFMQFITFECNRWDAAPKSWK